MFMKCLLSIKTTAAAAGKTTTELLQNCCRTAHIAPKFASKMPRSSVNLEKVFIVVDIDSFYVHNCLKLVAEAVV